MSLRYQEKLNTSLKEMYKVELRGCVQRLQELKELLRAFPGSFR